MAWIGGNWRRRFAGALVCASFAVGASGQVRFRLEPRDIIAKRLKSFRMDNQAREDAIRELFAQSGCGKANLSEEAAKFGLPPNAICVLPGETQEVIVVGAHTDHVTNAGDGVVDNWSGAALLPSLLFSLSGEKRRHTYVFVGFTGEERGMLGSEYYVDHLTAAERGHIDGMVNMDSLGLTSTKVWASHADQVMLDALASVVLSSKHPVGTSNVDNIGSTDSETFARYHIPRVTLHSVTPENVQVLHSENDKLGAIKMDDYYESYRLLAEYLAYLDDVLTATNKAKKN
jgi:aminopeptidase-like protein